MGDILVRYYEFAKQNGGLPAAMKLAMKTTMPSTRAAEAPDTPEAIAKVRAALQEILPGQSVPNLH